MFMVRNTQECIIEVFLCVSILTLFFFFFLFFHLKSCNKEQGTRSVTMCHKYSCKNLFPVQESGKYFPLLTSSATGNFTSHTSIREETTQRRTAVGWRWECTVREEQQ